jgi:hypothetical protein
MLCELWYKFGCFELPKYCAQVVLSRLLLIEHDWRLDVGVWMLTYLPLWC